MLIVFAIISGFMVIGALAGAVLYWAIFEQLIADAKTGAIIGAMVGLIIALWLVVFRDLKDYLKEDIMK